MFSFFLTKGFFTLKHPDSCTILVGRAHPMVGDIEKGIYPEKSQAHGTLIISDETINNIASTNIIICKESFGCQCGIQQTLSKSYLRYTFSSCSNF